MSDITIKRLSEADLGDFHAIRLEALQQAPQAFGSTYESEVLRPIAGFAERLANSIVFGAYSGGRIVGMAGLARYDGPKESHKAFVWGVYVRADMRARSVAGSLVQALIDHAPDGVEQILLTVVRENEAAEALYRRLGFTVYGEEPNALKTSAGYASEFLMIRSLAGRRD
jgi:ribosomal protein S18 acetylase RimI-like enzyme